jgi:hypothetical protein
LSRQASLWQNRHGERNRVMFSGMSDDAVYLASVMADQQMTTRH